jgi:acyl carrier protein
MSDFTAENVRTFLLKKFSGTLATRGLSPEIVPESFDLLAEGIIDSLGVLDMIGDVEREFGVVLDMEYLDAEQLTILGPFCQYAARNGKRSQG